VLPAAARAAAQSLPVFAPPIGLPAAVQITLRTLREAAQVRRKVSFDYADAAGRATHRRVRPLGCFYWGKVWTLAAWCETRGDFRSFRLDRIESATAVTGSTGAFRDDPGRSLADFLRAVAPPEIYAKWSNDS
jgi:predicted DNA-binding transcriptional regulator YafY